MHNRLSIQELYINKIMDEYKLLKQKFFESTNAFEKRLNDVCIQGWKPLSLAGDHSGKLSVLLQKVDKYDKF